MTQPTDTLLRNATAIAEARIRAARAHQASASTMMLKTLFRRIASSMRRAAQEVHWGQDA